MSYSLEHGRESRGVGTVARGGEGGGGGDRSGEDAVVVESCVQHHSGVGKVVRTEAVLVPHPTRRLSTLHPYGSFGFRL